MTDVEQPPSKQALKDMPLPALLAAIALVLGSIAAIFVALATIDKNGKDAIHAMLVVFEWSGGFAMFMSYFAPFFYIQRKWLATLVAIGIFLLQGLIVYHSARVPGVFNPDDPGTNFVIIVEGAGLYLFGLYALAKKFGVSF